MKTKPIALIFLAALLGLLLAPSGTFRGGGSPPAGQVPKAVDSTAPPATRPPEPPTQRPTPSAGLASLPAGEQKSIGEQIRAAQYWFTAHEPQWGRGAGLYAPCPGQKMAVQADEKGVALTTEGGEVAVELEGAAAAAPREEKERLVYERGGGLVEWYVNTPAGLEQGFTVGEEYRENRPHSEDLTLTLTLRTTLRPEQPRENSRITFRDAAGEARFFYDELHAWDATGRALPATMRLAEEGTAILLAVNDAGAAYPVTVDPVFFTQDSFTGEVAGQFFGNSLALSGNTLAVGTEASGANQAVYVFERTGEGWQQVKKIPAPPGAGGLFGFSVALDGDRLVAGSRNNLATQTAHIFERNAGGANNWGLVKTLVPSPVTTPGFFGAAVAVSGDLVAVGGFRENGAVADTGAVSIFLKDEGGAGNWGLQKRLQAADGQSGDKFGAALALQGTRLIVGSREFDGQIFNGGAASIFEQSQGGANQWGLVKKLLPPTPNNGGQFGNAVGLDGTRVIVGEVVSDANGSDDGAAHVFERNLGGTANWGLEQSLSVVDGDGGGSKFGSAVSLHGTRCLVGAVSFDSFGPTNQGGGAAFLFELSGGNWTQEADFFPDVPQDNGDFGAAVVLGEAGVAVANSSETVGALGLAGRVQIYEGIEPNGAWRFSAAPVVSAPGAVTVLDFGFSVAVDGSTLVVGAPESDDTADSGSGEGAAYVFERNLGGPDAWQLKRRLLGSSLGVNSGFGTSVSVRGDLIAVGAPTDTSSRGEVYVYSRNTGGAGVWGEIKRLNSPTNTVGEEFGFSVSLDANGTWLAVGAPGANNGGAVHVHFINTGGVNNFGLIKSIPHPPVGSFATLSGDRFGHAVSLDWPRLLVGAPEAEGNDRFDNPVFNAGRGYVFELNTGGVNNWGLEAEIAVVTSVALNTEGLGNAFQGTSVSLEGGLAALGSPGEATDKGSVNLYERNDSGANTWTNLRKITDPAGVAGDRFGESISLSGSRLAVGVPGSDKNNNDSGEVLVFLQNKGGADQWGLESRLGQPNCLPGAALGSSVALCGLDLAAGAPDLGSEGSAAVWRRELAGFQTVKTVNPSGSAVSELSLDGDFLAVGSAFDDIPTTNQGSVSLFRRNLGGVGNWGLIKKISAADGATGDLFGESASLSSGFLAVGASQDDDRGADSGSAYVFSRNAGGADNWGQVKKITPSDGAAGDRFGAAIATSGEVLVVGTVSSNPRAYIFERNQGGLENWGLSKQVLPSAGGIDSGWGETVALSGHTVAVGSGGNISAGGKVDIFSRNSGGAGNWGLLKAILPPSGAGAFGSKIAMDHESLAVGAPLDDTGGSDAGAVYIYDRNTGGANNWGNVKTLLRPSGGPNESYGNFLALDRGRLLATGNDLDTVEVYSRNSGGSLAWGLDEVISASATGSVAIQGTTAAIESGSNVVILELGGSAFDSWLRLQFGDAIVDDPTKEATHWGDAADFDRDGLSTLEEAFFNRNPLLSDAAGVRHEPVIISSALVALQWAQSPGEAFGIKACPQWSSDLTNWFVSGEDPPGAATARTIVLSKVGTLPPLDLWMAQVPRTAADKHLFIRLHLRRE